MNRKYLTSYTKYALSVSPGVWWETVNNPKQKFPCEPAICTSAISVLRRLKTTKGRQPELQSKILSKKILLGRGDGTCL